MRRALSPAMVGVAGLGLLLRVAIAVRSLDVLDRLFIPDDTYYTLAIARSLGRGEGPRIGDALTNGFQPLLALLLAPVFVFVNDPDIPLRVALLFLASCDAITGLLLGVIAARVGGRTAGLFAAAFWGVSPLAIGNALGGLETSLALCLELALVCSALAVGAGASSASRAKHAGFFGLLAGLCLLARVDSVFLVAALGMTSLTQRNWRSVAASGSIALVVVLPWWGYSLGVFGTIIPESGPAVASLVAEHRALYLGLPQQLAWSTGSLLGAPFFESIWLKEALFVRPVAATLAFAGTTVAVGTACWRLLPRRGSEAAVTALAVHGVAILAFYTFYLPAVWFFRRYLSPCHALLALLLALALGRAWERRSTMSAKLRLAAILAPFLAIAVRTDVLALYSSPVGTADQGLHGAKGYRDAARDVLALLPRPSVVGALQSGALAYYAEQSVRVVNLDGVVDRQAHRAIERGTLSDYARERAVGFIADWPFNLEMLHRLSLRSRTKPRLTFLGAARAQGTDGFRVYRAEWPE